MIHQPFFFFLFLKQKWIPSFLLITDDSLFHKSSCSSSHSMDSYLQAYRHPAALLRTRRTPPPCVRRSWRMRKKSKECFLRWRQVLNRGASARRRRLRWEIAVAVAVAVAEVEDLQTRTRYVFLLILLDLYVAVAA